MDRLERHISDLAQPVAADLGFELVRVRLTGGAKKTLQIMAERADGTMNAEDCASFSRALSVVLDAADPIAGDYILEVSSPGIDRPLTREKDYQRFAGHEAKLELAQLMEGRKRFRGHLAGFENGHVLIDLDGEEETALIPFDLIAAAKLVLTDELIAESLRAADAKRGKERETKKKRARGPAGEKETTT